ncbi:MAG: endonuclease V [Candidatus Kapaibacterium sp.]|nr:MAG: endonuclease V [Candidatus Kapabacteria bacterium]
MTEFEQQHLETLQRELSRNVIVPNRENSFIPRTDDELIFTLDVQYVDEEGFVALDVMRFGGEHLGIFVSRQRATFPYIPQFFSFREAPLLLNVIRTVMSEHGLQPALLLIDGHGLAHPRKFGIASHVGVEMNLPTIGCAKETLIRYAGELGELRGNTLPVVLDGEEVGRVLRTQNSKNPVFVSVGHLVELGVACEIVLNLSSAYRISEPLRRADQAARAFARGEERIFLGEKSLELRELSK